MANIASDWVQVIASCCGILGVFFLATGTFNVKSDARFIAPIIAAVGTGVGFGSVAFFVFGQRVSQLPFADALLQGLGLNSPIPLVVAIGLFFTLVGYGVGLLTLWGEVVSPGVRYRVVRQLAPIGTVLFIAAFGVILVGWIAPRPPFNYAGAALTLSLVGLSFLSLPAALYIPPVGLKVSGLILTVVGIVIAVAPAFLDLMQAAM